MDSFLDYLYQEQIRDLNETARNRPLTAQEIEDFQSLCEERENLWKNSLLRQL